VTSRAAEVPTPLARPSAFRAILSGLTFGLVALATVEVGFVAFAAPAVAAPAPATTVPSALTSVQGPTVTTVPAPPSPTVGGSTSSGPSSASVNISLGSGTNKPSDSLTIIILITLIGLAPSLLMMLTSFTRIVVVLSLTRNALGLQTIPPNQVVIGLAMFLSLFLMSPVFSQINKEAVQPYLHGKVTEGQAYNTGSKPLHDWMLKQTRSSELNLLISAEGQTKTPPPDKIGMAVLVPAFVLSELKAAFIIGFVIFIPFLVIDLIVSSSLMSMGMMMLPPVLVSLPFKILLFVLVDGWGLVVKSLITSYR
jgi:flagellar biosynthetic protein FliP